ncbi:MAG: DUF1018 domain-containing protein [Rhodopseudomonas sp.]|nr:DUF1018 domain-containing protein [Rhodopseudomonas sp.]
MSATAPQIAAIHTLAKKAGMDDDVRRDFMEREAGVRSSKALSAGGAARVIDKLKALSLEAGVAGAVAGLTSPAAKKMRALWIAAYDLGLVRDRSDRAMLSFLERQCGVSHTRFLREPGQATSAIEALKSWLKRDGKVAWPARESWKKDGKADGDEIAASKRAVIDAQWMMLVTAGAAPVAAIASPLAELDNFAVKIAGRRWGDFDLNHYDTVQKALGRKLRAALAKTGAAA